MMNMKQMLGEAGRTLSNRDMAMLSPKDRLKAQQMMGMSDNEPMMQDRSLGNQIFTLQSQINNLMNDYNIAIRDQGFNTAQAIADQINNIDVAITQLQSQMPMGLGQKKN